MTHALRRSRPALAMLLAALPTLTQADPALPARLSPLGMFRAADPVVQGVMIGLALASVVTWTILLAKLAETAAAARRNRRAAAMLAAAPSLAATPALSGAPAQMLAAARDEIAHSLGLPAAGVKERIALTLRRIEAQAARRLARGTGILASVGATAPFVGLFGTVWGIMNAFIGISEAQSTSLAIVAPGIAEALLATAMGLIAAIPAVLIYNGFARILGAHRAGLADTAARIEVLAGRQIDGAAA